MYWPPHAGVRVQYTVYTSLMGAHQALISTLCALDVTLSSTTLDAIKRRKLGEEETKSRDATLQNAACTFFDNIVHDRGMTTLTSEHGAYSSSKCTVIAVKADLPGGDAIDMSLRPDIPPMQELLVREGRPTLATDEARAAGLELIKKRADLVRT